MSICEHMIGGCDSEHTATQPTTDEKLLNIQNELIWGLTYRNYKENERKKPMKPMHSPINIPFELCRAEMRMGHKKRPIMDFVDVEATQHEGKGDSKNIVKKSQEKSLKSGKKRKFSENEKPTLLDRNVWSQSMYMDFLSIPNPKFYEEPKPKKYKKRCELEPCPPRFVQLAVPNKRRVFQNWKDYEHFLPTEMLMRYEEILHTDQNLDPREARYYYKKLDRQKRKELKAKRRLEKKKKMEKEKDINWLQTQIDIMAKDIVDYIQDEPLFTLNYKQLLLSDGILSRLERTKIIKKPSRKTKNQYKKTIIEVSDKFAVWIDTLTRFVDVQAIESDEDIPPVSISTLSGESEGEGESDYESSSEEELRDEQLFEPTEGFWGEEGAGDQGADEMDNEAAEALLEDFFKPGEGEDAQYLDEMLNDLDGDVLEKLIQILSNCSDDFLDSEIDAEKMPDVKYRDVLEKLKKLKDGMDKEGGKPFLEQVLIDWAMRNDPDHVNDEIIQKIHEIAGLLGDWLTASGAEGDKGAGEGIVAGEEEEAETPGKEGAEAEKDVPEDENANASAEDTTGEQEVTGEEAAPGEEGATAKETETGEEGGTAKDTEPGEEGGTAIETEPGEEGGTAKETEPEEEGGTEKETEPEEEGGTAKETEPGEEEGVPGEEGTPAGTVEGADESKEETDISEGAEHSQGTIMDEFGMFEAEGGVVTPGGVSDLEGEEGFVSEYEPEALETDEEALIGEGGAGEEVSGPYEPSEPSRPPVEAVEAGDVAVSRLEGKVIKGHKAEKVFEHSPDTVCCLSLKTWAVWLLEITHNAHNWTQWMSCVIQKVREYAAIVRGDVKDANGQNEVLRKAEWRKFIAEAEESVIAWRQYSAHVKDLSQSIVDNFHDKKVNCCPKCLQDHLITNVVVAHDTLQALTEAISCAAYWQRCLDTLVEKTCSLTQIKKDGTQLEVSSEESEEDVDLEDVDSKDEKEESCESVYEIEGFEPPSNEENSVAA